MTTYRILALGVLSLLGFTTTVAAQAIPSNTQVQREVDRALARLGATESFQARAATAGNPAAALQMGATLSRHGLARLDSATLTVRAEVLVKLFSTADVATCAAWSRGTLEMQQSMALFNSMDSVTTSRWGDVSARAIVAEMNATAPSPAPSSAEFAQLFASVKTVMSAADRTRFDELLPRLATAPDADMCWFSRTMYISALRLPQAERATALSLIARIEAQ